MKKNLIYLLLAMSLFFTSCNNDEESSNIDRVQISFRTELPKQIGTRSIPTGLNVNRIVCAVFENQKEVSSLREVIDVKDGTEIIYSPQLIKGRTYNVVFWGMKDNNYNVTDMKSITRSKESTIAETDFDAFTASITINVTGSKSETVILKRPFALLNIGVTENDWNTIANEETFGRIPTSTTITIKGKDTFNALTGMAEGHEKEINYNLPIMEYNLNVENETYKEIAMCYVLPDTDKENKDITYSVYDQDNKTILKDISIKNVPLERNFRTNIVGDLLTGTITYTIVLEKDFHSEEKNETIE